MTPMLKKSLVISALGLLCAGSALAADVVTPSGQNPMVTVGSNEVHKNLYTAGANVLINANTAGDLTVAGGQVSIVGDVEQELLLAGGDLSVSGAIGGTARVAGGNITISGPVGGDLVVAGGNVILGPKASVGGDVLMAGGSLTLDGPVKGSVRIMAGTVTINSKVSGNVNVQTSQVLEFGSGAEVSGTVYHKGPEKAVVDSGAKVGNIQYTQWQPGTAKNFFVAAFTAAFLLKILAWMLVAWVLIRLRKSEVMELADSVQRRPWQSLGWGLVYFAAFPVAAILLFITLVGYYAAFVVAIVYVLLLLLAKILAAITIGFVIVRMLSKPMDQPPLWQPVIIGTVVWSVLGLIPFVGWIIILVVFLQSLGALGQMFIKSFKSAAPSTNQ